MSKAPPAGKKFPCKQCGARVDFDPASRTLKCPYCGLQEDIAPDSKGVEERPLDAYLQKRNTNAKVIEGRSSQVTCGNCGAMVLLEDKVATDRCPYCGTHLDNKPQTAENMIEPEGVLPFKVQRKQAIEAFDVWIKGLWFAPGMLRKFADLGNLMGFYIPFWTFDSMTYTHYTGQRGDDYHTTEHYTETETYFENGETKTRDVQKTRTVTHTNWTWVSGEVDHFFDDVLICASKGLPEKYASRVTTSELGELEEFRPEFLSGFKTERYVIDPAQGFEEAKVIMDGEIRHLCCRDIGGDHQQLSTVKTQHVGVTFKHILLPVWMASYRFQNKSFRVMVNGRTGEVLGDRPYSVVKIIGLILAIVLAIGAAIYLIHKLSSGPARQGRGSDGQPHPVVARTGCDRYLDTERRIPRVAQALPK